MIQLRKTDNMQKQTLKQDAWYVFQQVQKVLKQKVKFSRQIHMLHYITHVKDAQQRCIINSSEVTVIANTAK